MNILSILQKLFGDFLKPEVISSGAPASPQASPQGQMNLQVETPRSVATPVPQVPRAMAAEGESPIPGYNRARGLPAPQILDLIQKASKSYNVPPALIAAILFNESGFNPRARNENKPGNIDRGIAQINTVAYPEITDDQADDPNFAIDFLARTISDNVKHFGDINKGIQAYNVGRGGVNMGRGSEYLSKVYKNLEPEYAKELGISSY